MDLEGNSLGLIELLSWNLSERKEKGITKIVG
jgi:hypothetical protein